MHDAQKYLMNPDRPNKLRVIYNDQKRTLFLAKGGGFGIISKGSRTRGSLFNDWDRITKIHYPAAKKSATEIERNMVRKFKKYASKAGFANPFIRKCLIADENKTGYDNGISGGSINSGKIISLTSIAKKHPWEVKLFRQALAEKKPYRSQRIRFRGYEMTLSLEQHEEDSNYTQPGDIMGYLSLEYKDCWNGYYYLLINEENFIGYDKD